MPREPISTVLFDLDGTLIDTYRLYMEAYRRALTPVFGHVPADAEILAKGPVSEREVIAHWCTDADAEPTHAAMLASYAELHRTHYDGVYAGVREMLDALRSAGLRLGIVTGKSRGGWEITRDHLDLGAFEVVVTEDEMEAPKPDPCGLELALRELRVEGAAALYVGDSLSDVHAARAAGVRTAAVLWPKTAPGERERFIEALRPLAPHWILEHPGELTRALASWC